MNRHLFIFIIGSILAIQKGECQQSTTLRYKKIAAKGIIKMDSSSLLPNSVLINNIDTSYYNIDPINSTIQWKKETGKDSILISYRIIPFTINKVTYRYNYDSVKNRFLAANKMVGINKINSIDDYFGNKKLNYSGSFGRNMSFGNTQDASFNSVFNIQINGLINDSIQMMAAISDNNIPIQPDGNTKQLNEFDRILIQFKKNNHELNIGDIDIKENQHYFLNFNKRTQGVLLKSSPAISSKHALSLGAGIAKGKFTRNIFHGLEGNQGPYRLQGANNEIYFVVLSNSEKVYIDGELLQRGIDQDYIINYNTAEITFTTKRLITKDKRIQIEFEYADKNYLNYLAFGEDVITVNKKLNISIAAYSNNDVASSPINQTLNNNQTKFLANIGDSIGNAFYPVNAKDTFSSGQIMYKKVDTLHNGVHDSIYVYSISADSAFYTLNFVFTGNNKGNYIPYYNAANGKVYAWVAPVNGIPQGSYEPAIFLVTPKSQQLISIKSDYIINKNSFINAEIAGSHYDVNTLSTKDKQNDYGYAGKINYQHNYQFKKELHHYELNLNTGYEYVHENFKSLEVIRNVEFARDWGLNLVNSQASEQLPSINLKIKDEKNNIAEYGFSAYVRSDGYKGTMNKLQLQKAFSSWKLQSFVQYTDNSTPTINGYYLKPIIELQKIIKQLNNLTISGNYNSEYNYQKYKAYDSLSQNSFGFTSYCLQLKSNTLKPNKWSIGYTQRTNIIPIGNALVNNDNSSNYTFAFEILKNRNHQFRTNVTYRDLQQEYGNSKGSKENTVLSRSEYVFSEYKGALRGNIIYEIGNGQEQKKDLSYIQVANGKGQYVWIDYNKDGIQQLNEFEIAQFQDQANFVRIYTPTNNYTKSNYTIFGYNLQVNPIHITLSNKNIQHFIRLMSLQSSLQTQAKTIYDGNLRFNPFKSNLIDTSLVQNNYIWNNTLTFNRGGNWGIDAGRNSSINISLLTYGIESSKQTAYTIRGRFSFKQKFQLELLQKFDNKSLLTPSFNNRNYTITGFITEPRLTYSPTTQIRIMTYYQYGNNKNQIEYGGETAINNSITIESKINFIQSAGLNLKFVSNEISYTGISNNTVSYVMLNGLQPGKNYLWNIEYTKRIMNSLEISFNYEGRKSGEGPTVNIGRASVRAIL